MIFIFASKAWEVISIFEKKAFHQDVYNFWRKWGRDLRFSPLHRPPYGTWCYGIIRDFNEVHDNCFLYVSLTRLSFLNSMIDFNLKIVKSVAWIEIYNSTQGADLYFLWFKSYRHFPERYWETCFYGKYHRNRYYFEILIMKSQFWWRIIIIFGISIKNYIENSIFYRQNFPSIF